MNLYEVMGVPKNATKDQIKKAYRKKSTVHHPDKGGDPEEFKTLVRAYNILFDDEKRKRYDSGESEETITKSAMTEDQEIMNLLLNIFIQAVQACDPDRENIFSKVKSSINLSIKEIHVQISKANSVISKFERATKRIKTKNEENVFVLSANAQIAGCQSAIANLNLQLSRGQGALKLMEAYSYEIRDGGFYGVSVTDYIYEGIPKQFQNPREPFA